MGSQEFTRDVLVEVKLKTLPNFFLNDHLLDFWNLLVFNSVCIGLAVSFLVPCGSQHGLNGTVVASNSSILLFRVGPTTEPLDQVHDNNKAKH